MTVKETPERPRLLDLFSCAGGAAVGYHRAGFEVVGVDIAPQPRYPFEFHQADALEFLAEHGDEFDAIHASPPCQGYTGMSNKNPAAKAEWPRLIGPVRDALEVSGRPWVIENVVGARSEMPNAMQLHGGMFGLGVDRPRLFEASFALMGFGASRAVNPVGVYGKLDGRRLWTRSDGSELRNPRTLEEASIAMGIDWMFWDELREAIPPAFTEFIGEQLIRELECSRV